MNLEKIIKIELINGPNLNMLGYRDQGIYGQDSYEELIKKIKAYALKKSKEYHIKVLIKEFQANEEGALITKIQNLVINNDSDALIINPGAYAHYAIGIRDALELYGHIKVEVHLSDIKHRETFRKISLTQEVCDTMFYGQHIFSYYQAIDYIINKVMNNDEN
ncbi:MAG: 3-dehydroquinate dehydratase [Bacilli bacterium]|jgi:3-dehydroquinate dehydratase-2|nr:3-dehydroquinate dehydratase [Bacilli bacterium]